MRLNRLVVAVALVVAMTGAVHGAEEKPTIDGALAWLKKLDAEYKVPRFADLTVEKLKALSEIKLGGHRKSDNKHVAIEAEDLRYLTVLPALKKASLGEVDGLTDASMKHVGEIKTLTELDLSDAAIGNDGLEPLAALTDLTVLKLAFARQIGDDGMDHVAKLSKLETLFLSGTKVTDAGLKKLSGLSKLKELRLGGQMEITDAGLAALGENTALTKLVVGKKTKVTDAGVAALKAKLPKLEVERK
jgi:hypothetical protein